jgi:serine/threonine protein kinase
MTKLSDLYTDFFRVDLDAPGGYARVADVVAHQQDGTLVHRAFKLMRHELGAEQIGLQRFENELKILTEITKDENAPSAITRIYDSGFTKAELSENLHELQNKNKRLIPTSDLEIISTGTDAQKFLDLKTILMGEEPNRWLPYLVVELAPYDDSLRRQIWAHSEGELLNLYALPVNTIVDMALQLLDMMDYLHKKLRVAYIDWKPEHIYWNEASRQLKLIDWNVVTRLDGGLTEKKIIREDVRLFCGAALYCSLALNDPEELKRPIGTAPEGKTPVIPPRYWTDNPDFYQREEILDVKIKKFVQKGLDPNQGFTSPLELKNALYEYSKQINSDLITGVPFEAVQHFRRARSYIAAKDYVYANIALEIAVEIAGKARVIYPDAEQLLRSVRDILEVDEIKRQSRSVLQKGQWKEALDLYATAIKQYPNNMLLKKEFDGFQDLLQTEVALKRKGAFKLFYNLFKLRNVLDSAKDIINFDNPLYGYVKHQYDQIRIAQLSGIFMLLISVSFALILVGKLNLPLMPAKVTTTAFTFSPSPKSTEILQSTSKPTFTDIPSFTPTNTVTPTPIITPLAYGKLEAFYFKPYDEPNKNILGDVAIERNQFLTILAEKVDGGALWYKCAWEIDGVVYQGWILADRIKLMQVPPTRTSFVLENVYGVLDVTSYKPYAEPNKTLQDIVLKKNQPLKIIRRQEFASALWYECEWEIDGVAGRGWILADKIKIIQPPTPIPTATS